MARRRPNQPRRKHRSTTPHADSETSKVKIPFGCKACLGAVAALLVARVFVPEDPGGAQGLGAAFVMLWLVLGCCAAFLGSKWRNKTFRWGWPESALAVLIGWHTLSALVAAGAGAPRQAVNLMWDWIALGAAFLLVRQLIRTPQAMSALLCVMVGLAAALSMVGIRQYFVTIPADQAAYAAVKGDLRALYQLTGEWLPPDSSHRIQFENRLATNQPTATFGLANSLAAFLLPWMILLVGALLTRLNDWKRASDDAWPGKFATSIAVAALLLMFVCLGLTQSRSAILSAAFGLAVVTVTQLDWLRNGRRLVWSAILTVVALGFGAILVAATTAGRAAWSAAWRSVSFRLDYWRATVRMILDHLFLGVGPGQFQDHYVSYKLPTASEEIQDPHNWLFEIWATAGTIAAITMLAFIAVVAIKALSSRDQWVGNADRPADDAWSYEETVQWMFAGGIGGVLLGVILAWLSGYPVDSVEVVLFVCGLAVAPILWQSSLAIQNSWVPLCLVAAGTMLVNLLAAGGIGYPSVAESFWLLVAIALTGMELKAALPQAVGAKHQATIRRWLPIAAWLVLMLAALWSEYLPVTGCRLQLDVADRTLVMGDAKQLRAALEGAVAADPWSVTAARRLVSQRFDDYEKQPTSVVREMFEAANSRVLELAPRRSGLWQQSSEFYSELHDRSRLLADLETAIAHAQRAVSFYPTNARMQAHLAKLYNKAAKTRQAQAAAAEAIRLDDLMRQEGHPERLLTSSLREELVQIAGKRGN